MMLTGRRIKDSVIMTSRKALYRWKMGETRIRIELQRMSTKNKKDFLRLATYRRSIIVLPVGATDGTTAANTFAGSARYMTRSRKNLVAPKNAAND
jgi:hypothetical protein